MEGEGRQWQRLNLSTYLRSRWWVGSGGGDGGRGEADTAPKFTHLFFSNLIILLFYVAEQSYNAKNADFEPPTPLMNSKIVALFFLKATIGWR
jgi:hypothetical protein